MPRRKSTNPAPTPKAKSHKRALSSSATVTPTPTVAATTSSTPGSRASKRLKESATSSPSTGKKSKYFEGPGSDEEEEEDDDDDDDDKAPSSDEEGSDFNGADDDDSAAEPSSASPSPSASEDEDDYESDEDRKKPKKKQQQRGQKSSRRTTAAESGAVATAAGIADKAIIANKELWREGVKTGLGPGKQVFIERPKPRGDGGIKYVPGRIHPNTMAFLADLKQNNDREWLKLHDPDYRTSWNDWTTFVESLTEKIIEKDETIPELPPKDLVFRIYRDIRFSSDQTPYKTHFSAAWSRTGRKGPYAAYYVQIAPEGGSFVGAGLWMPEAQPLALLRRDIDHKPEVIRRVLTDATLRKKVLGGIPNDEKKAVKAFASHNAESALKTKPKGYDADNPNIELLRLRNFTIGKKISDEEVINPNGLDTIVDLICAMTPFVTYLNDVVMPDSTGSPGGSGSESGESEAEEE